MPRSSLTPEHLAQRLAQVELRTPQVNRRRAERAVAAHLAALGIEPKPVRWIWDPWSMDDRWESRGCNDWLNRFSRRKTPVDIAGLPILRTELARTRKRNRFDVIDASNADR